VNVSGVSGSALLGAPFSVCNSQVYPISTLLLPATTIAGVPDVLAAAGEPAQRQGQTPPGLSVARGIAKIMSASSG